MYELYNHNTNESEIKGSYENCYQYATKEGYVREVGCVGKTGKEPGDLFDGYSIRFIE